MSTSPFVKISQLPLANALTGEELVEVVQNGDNKQITTADLFGKTAYQLAIDAGFVGTRAQWLTSLKGATGADGKSAYTVALENGFSGTEAQWAASLHGEKGDKGDMGDRGPRGDDGTNGLSAYEAALGHGFIGSETQWLASLKGANGTNGADGAAGKSAYDVAVSNGFVGTEAQWLESLGNVKQAKLLKPVKSIFFNAAEELSPSSGSVPYLMQYFTSPDSPLSTYLGLGDSFIWPYSSNPDDIGIWEVTSQGELDEDLVTVVRRSDFVPGVTHYAGSVIEVTTNEPTGLYSLHILDTDARQDAVEGVVGAANRSFSFAALTGGSITSSTLQVVQQDGNVYQVNTRGLIQRKSVATRADLDLLHMDVNGDMDSASYAVEYENVLVEDEHTFYTAYFDGIGEGSQVIHWRPLGGTGRKIYRPVEYMFNDTDVELTPRFGRVPPVINHSVSLGVAAQTTYLAVGDSFLLLSGSELNWGVWEVYEIYQDIYAYVRRRDDWALNETIHSGDSLSVLYGWPTGSLTFSLWDADNNIPADRALVSEVCSNSPSIYLSATPSGVGAIVSDTLNVLTTQTPGIVSVESRGVIHRKVVATRSDLDNLWASSNVYSDPQASVLQYEAVFVEDEKAYYLADFPPESSTINWKPLGGASNPEDWSVEMLDPDENGVYTRVRYYDLNGVTQMESVLSFQDGVTGLYSRRTENYYVLVPGDEVPSITRTIEYSLQYNDADELIREEQLFGT